MRDVIERPPTTRDSRLATLSLSQSQTMWTASITVSEAVYVNLCRRVPICLGGRRSLSLAQALQDTDITISKALLRVLGRAIGVYDFGAEWSP